MRRDGLVFVFAAASYVFGTSCAPLWVPLRPAKVAAPPDGLSRASRVLVETGETIERKDEDGGFVVTKWSDGADLTYRSLQTRIMITLDGGTLVVSSQCQRHPVYSYSPTPSPGMRPKWEPCGDRQPVSQQAKVDRIAAALR